MNSVPLISYVYAHVTVHSPLSTVVKASLYNLGNNQSLEFPNETDLVNYVRAEQGRPPASIEIPPEVLEERMGDELGDN